MVLPEFPQTAANLIASLTDADMLEGGHREHFFPLLLAARLMGYYGKEIGAAMELLSIQVAEDAASAAAGSGTETTVADIRAGAAAQYLSIRSMLAANAFVALSDGASIAWDMASGINFEVVLAGVGRALANPSSVVVGKSGLLIVKQDATGGRTITSWGSHFVWLGERPTWPTTPAAETIISYIVRGSNAIYLNWGGNSAE